MIDVVLSHRWMLRGGTPEADNMLAYAKDFSFDFPSRLLLIRLYALLDIPKTAECIPTIIRNMEIILTNGEGEGLKAITLVRPKLEDHFLTLSYEHSDIACHEIIVSYDSLAIGPSNWHVTAATPDIPSEED